VVGIALKPIASRKRKQTAGATPDQTMARGARHHPPPDHPHPKTTARRRLNLHSAAGTRKNK